MEKLIVILNFVEETVYSLHTLIFLVSSTYTGDENK